MQLSDNQPGESKPRPSWRRRLYGWSVLAGIVASVMIILVIGIPWTAMKIGIRPVFSWSLLRIGHTEVSRRYKMLSGHTYRGSVLYNGPVFALAGESLVMHYKLAPAADSPGKLGINVTQLIGPHRTWHRDFDQSTIGEETIRLGPDHFYWITVAYNQYLGKAWLDWFVTHQPVR